MGGRHGKILNSLGLSRGEPRSGDPTERALFRVRSCSLDSISTAVSLSTTAQIAPNHSSSLDNLHQPWEREGTSGVPNNSREESGKKYMMLEKSSVFSSNTAVCADEQRKSELTQSLPADGARHVALHSHSQSAGIGAGLDGFSDNFVISTAGEEEPRGSSGIAQTKPQLHQEQYTTEQGAQTIKGQQQAKVTASGLAPPPEIPLGLLQKLSQQEWNQLITFVSSTVEHSLQSAQAQRNPQQQLPLLQQSTEVRAEREMLEHQKTPGHRRRRKTRKERPKSLPPPYLKQECERTEREHLEEDAQKEGVRQRSHSHEDCYHYRCTEPVSAGYSCKASRSSSFRKNCNCRIHRCHCEHRNDSHMSVRRKKSSKSKDFLVDPSLDDNCPGIPENRVRRTCNRHHRQSICERCLGSLNEERRRQRHARPHSPKEDEGKEGAAAGSSKDEQGSGEEEEVDRIGYLTLDELRTAALLLRRSVGHPEDENLCISRVREHSGGRGEGGTSSNRRRHSKSKTKHSSLEVSSVECVPSQLQPQKLAQKVDNSELVFPLKSRTGRDSPATDMAVINLDLNTPNMLAPVDPEGTADCLYQQQAYVASDSSLNNTRVVASTNGSTIQHLYLYNHHHHYHHIIHHSQP